MAEEVEEEAESVPEAWEITASDGTKFAFVDVNELRQFVVYEHERWSWLRGAPHSALRTLLQNSAVALKQAVVRLSTPEPPFEMGAEPVVRSIVEQYLEFTPALHSRAQLQPFIWELTQRDQHMATAALGWILRAEGRLKSFERESVSDFGWASGIAEAIIWRRGLAADDAAVAAQNRAERAARDAEALRDRTAEASLSSVRTAQEMATASEASAAAAAKIQTETQAKGNEQLLKYQEEWNRLTKTYDVKLALSSPSKYWQAKADTHKLRSIQFGVGSGVFAVSGAAALWFLMRWLFQGHAMDTLPTWGQVLPTTLAVVIYLWTLKTLLRLTMSHVHLSLDSAERRVMIMSYLALSRRREVSPDDLKSLFAAIFRPSGDGIVKDETPPLPLSEILRGGRSN